MQRRAHRRVWEEEAFGGAGSCIGSIGDRGCCGSCEGISSEEEGIADSNDEITTSTRLFVMEEETKARFRSYSHIGR